MQCQRRTGAPFGVSTYSPRQQVRIAATSKLRERGSGQGRKIKFRFCLNCGVRVFWNAEFVPEHLGTAFWAFADPSIPLPTVSVWEATRHRSATFDHELDRFQHQVDRTDGAVTVRR